MRTYCCVFGERQIMQEKLERYINNQKFGKLELVDREIFYLSFNTRDN